jgi:membrane protease YdiL (CAAX protease family)
LHRKLKFHYIFGTLVGTFFGMLAVIILLDSLSQKILDYSNIIVPIVIPLFFVVLSFFQAHKVYKKYLKKKIR